MKQATAGLLVSLTALTATPAVALECVYGSVQQDYWRHKESAETYLLVYGRFSEFSLIESVTTSETADGMRFGRTIYSARFDGFRASRQAFDQPLSTDVTLIFPDESYIGGGYDTSGEAERLGNQVGLVWFLRTEAGYQASASSCSAIMNTDPSHVKPLLRCLRGGYCPKG